MYHKRSGAPPARELAKRAIVKKGRQAMSLNAKDPEALHGRYQRLRSRRARASVEELRAIAKRAAAHIKGPYLGHAEFLYDERGLPK
jgi:antitoxin VapB